MDATVTVGAGAFVRRFYELLYEGKLDEMLGMLDDEAVIRESPALPYGGDYRGGDGLRELVTRMSELVDVTTAEPIRYLEAGDNRVVLRIRGRFTARFTGRTTEMSVVEVVTLRDGHIAEIDVYYKDPAAIDAILLNS